MSDLKFHSMTVQVAFVIQEPPIEVENQEIALTPYEQVLEFPVAELLADTNLDGEFVLGLYLDSGDNYLVRIKSEAGCDLDKDEQLTFEQGAFKIRFTHIDRTTGATIVDTEFYRIDEQKGITKDALGPSGKPEEIDLKSWKWILIRVPERKPAFYRLVRFESIGLGLQDPCEKYGCDDTPLSSAKRRLCAKIGC